MSRKEDRNAKMLRALGQEELLEGQAYLNTFVLENYIRRLAVTQFTWESECDIDFDIVESLLFNNGAVAFWQENGVLMYGTFVARNFDFYGIPTEIDVQKSNCTNATIKGKENFVIVYDNTVKNFIPFVTMKKYCEMIANVDSAMETNLENLKTPVIIECEESQLTTFQNIVRRIRNNKKTIPVAKGTFDRSGANVLNLNCPNNIPSLMEYREFLMNECLMQFGIDCVNIRKKERLTKDESTSNNERIELFRISREQPRKRACKELESKFGIIANVKRNGGVENGIDNGNI